MVLMARASLPQSVSQHAQSDHLQEHQPEPEQPVLQQEDVEPESSVVVHYVPAFTYDHFSRESLTVSPQGPECQVVLVLDTACQRIVTSTQWFQSIPSTMVKQTKEKEQFRFGIGNALSEVRGSMGLALAAHQPVFFAVRFSVVNCVIPLLFSRAAMDVLGDGVVLHQPVSCQLLRVSGCAELPLCQVNGHLGICLWMTSNMPEPDRVRDASISLRQ